MFPEAIKRRREQHSEAKNLSDWQVHSAHLTAGAISSLDTGFETGPIYVPMPTGAGKTIGAQWGIIGLARENPDVRLCFMTPYTESVDSVYKTLSDELGPDVVGYYHSNAIVIKEVELSKRVLVITHSFIEHNQGRLDDRDLFIVDEAIYATGEATLRLQDFKQQH